MNSSLAKVAYESLYDDSSNYLFEVKYSAKFSAYNANVKLYPSNNKFSFSLSKDWKGVSQEIVIGLIQHLILKIKGHKKKTLNIDLYEGFLKNVNEYVAKNNIDLYLKVIFDDINDKFFNGLMGECNLKWGSFSKRTLGHYSFGSDTITISTIFKSISDEKLPLLELVMYHEMLHKKHKFETSGTNNLYHTPAFRKEEKRFPNYETLEKELHTFARYKRDPAKSNAKAPISVKKKRILDYFW